MTTIRTEPTRQRRFEPRWVLLGLVVTCLAAASPLAQVPPADVPVLRKQVEERFDILPLQNGVVLRPRARTDIRSVEVTDGAIAVDGQAVTGAELRSRLAADADVVLQVSYLDAQGRRALTASLAASAPAETSPSSEPQATVPSPPSPPPTPPSRRRSRDRRGGNDRVRFGGSIDVEEGETINGDVVAIGGSVDVKGKVDGDVVAVGGSVDVQGQVTGDAVAVMGGLDLGPRAVVEGDAVAVGGSLDRAEGARVDGEVHEVGIGAWKGGGRWTGSSEMPRNVWRPFGSLFSLLSTLVRVGVLCLLAALVMLVARDQVDRIAQRAVAEPLKAGAVGLLAQLLFVPLLIVTILLLLVTIVGIPLLVLVPFGVLALMVFALMGFTAVASYVGQWLTARFGWTGYSSYVTTAAGIVLIASPLVLARLIGLGGGPLWLMSFGLAMVGFLCEYVAWTIGIGAVALQRFSPAAPVQAPSVAA